MTTTTPNLARFLNPPRLPRACPVLALYLRADSDPSGNARHSIAVLTPTGRMVEVIGHDDTAEQELKARYPWYDHNAARALGIQTAYTVRVDVSVSELRRFQRAGAEMDIDRAETPSELAPDVQHAYALATRAAKWLAVREALTTIRRHSAGVAWCERIAEREGRPDPHAKDPRGAVVYHRHPHDGGDAVSDHLRRAMAAFVAAGIVVREDDPDAIERSIMANPDDSVPSGQRLRRAHFFRHSVGHYSATDSTPDLY